MNHTICLDNKMADLWYPLRPMFNTYQINTPHEVSGNVFIPKPPISAISDWLEA
jgi:hypothetical protein